MKSCMCLVVATSCMLFLVRSASFPARVQHQTHVHHGAYAHACRERSGGGCGWVERGVGEAPTCATCERRVQRVVCSGGCVRVSHLQGTRKWRPSRDVCATRRRPHSLNPQCCPLPRLLAPSPFSCPSSSAPSPSSFPSSPASCLSSAPSPACSCLSVPRCFSACVCPWATCACSPTAPMRRRCARR